MDNIKEPLIPLQAAHVNMYPQLNDKTIWEVQENKTNILLHEFRINITENDMFSILDFARKYELAAFDIGMKHMNREMTEKLNQERKKYQDLINELEIANTKLADKLETLIGEEAT